MLSVIQERVERSIFEAIRLVLVAEGYTPDIANTGLYGVEPYTDVNQAAWETALDTIAATKGFAIDLKGHSQTKGIRKVPRIVIISRRVLPGDMGAGPDPWFTQNPSNPVQLVKMALPAHASNFYFDIHLISGNAKQDRVLNSVLSKSLGLKKYINWYDDVPNKVFLKQTSYYDLPDPLEGQEEKVYTYEVPDLYDVPDEFISVVPINEINMELIALAPDANLNADGTVDGESTEDGGVKVTGSGIEYN